MGKVEIKDIIMKYTEVTITISKTDAYRDLLIYSLGDEGPYDSFENTANGVKNVSVNASSVRRMLKT